MLLGALLSKVQIEKTATASGAYGSVYVAFDDLARAYCVKLMKKHVLGTRRLFNQEIWMLKMAHKIGSPNLLKLLDYDEDEDYFRILTPLHRGGDLRDGLAILETLSWKEREELVKCTMIKILRGVNDLHQQNLVHRYVNLIFFAKMFRPSKKKSTNFWKVRKNRFFFLS